MSSAHLLLPLLYTLGHGGPYVALVNPESRLCFRRSDKADVVDLPLLAVVSSESGHRVHHMAPVLLQPLQRVLVPAVGEGDGHILGLITQLLRVLRKQISLTIDR